MPRAAILLVDDQPANLLALEAVLVPLGHELALAGSGADALKQLLLRDFALILLDARMPGLDGFETAALIRQRERSALTPIIFLTAAGGDHQDIRRAYELGAVDFLAKPFEPTILRAKVTIFVSLYLQGRQLKLQAARMLEQERAAARAEEARLSAERLREKEMAQVAWLEERQRTYEQHAAALGMVSAELVRSNRELEQVAYGASHDLKAPLRGISTVCEWLEEELAEVMTDEARKHFGQMRSRIRRMSALVDGILAFARVGQGRAEPELVDIGALIADVVELLQAPTGATITITRPIPVARVQRQLLEHVFANLIGNALKYARRPDPRIEISFTEQARFLEFQVTDNGPGIAKQSQERIWELFQRLESQKEIEGTGVGLALVKKVVEGQGGRAWVESEPGHGASFHFLWRIAPTPPAGGAAVDQGQPSPVAHVTANAGS